MPLQLPAYITNRQVGKLDDFIGGLGISQPPRISLNGDRFTLLDETGMTIGEPSLSVDIIIVGVNKNASRIYYDKSKPYDANAHDAPLCWSDNGVGPSKSCVAPQALTCASCPQAVWGSAVGQGNKPIPACGTTKKIAVLVNGQDGLFPLAVPPGSLTSFKMYISRLAKMPVDPELVITRVKMENKELLFEEVDVVPEELLEYIDELKKNDDAASIVNRFDEARDPNEFKMLPTPELVPSKQLMTTENQVFNPLPAQMPQPRRPGRPKNEERGLPPPTSRQGVVHPPIQPRTAPLTEGGPDYGPAGQKPPPEFGFGVNSQPVAPDQGVQSMLDRAFPTPPTPTAPFAPPPNTGVSRAFSLPRRT